MVRFVNGNNFMSAVDILCQKLQFIYGRTNLERKKNNQILNWTNFIPADDSLWQQLRFTYRGIEGQMSDILFFSHVRE